MKNKYFAITLFVLTIMGNNNAFAEKNKLEKLTIDKFIKTAEKDTKLNNQKELTRYLSTAPESTPYVDKIELRTETEDFDLDKQKYSFRVYPKGWNETKYTRNVAGLLKASSKTEENSIYNDALKDRYNLVLSYLETKSLISLKKTLATVCEDRINVLKKKNAESISFDISDLIAAEELLTELRLGRVGLENKLTGLEEKIRIAANTRAPIDFRIKSLVRIKEIQKLVNKMRTGNIIDNVRLEDQKNKMNLADNKYKLEQSKNRDYISFLQLSYDHDDYDEPKKAYSFEVAIKLPFINSDRDDVNRRKVNYMKEKLQYEEERRSLSEKKKSLIRSIERLISQFSLLVDNKKNGNAEVSLKAYMKMDGMDPLNILKIKSSIIQNDIQLVKTGFNIRYKFIELLEMTGKLSEKPVRNYIGS